MASKVIPVMLIFKPKDENIIAIKVYQKSVEIENIHGMTAELLDKTDLSGYQG